MTQTATAFKDATKDQPLWMNPKAQQFERSCRLLWLSLYFLEANREKNWHAAKEIKSWAQPLRNLKSAVLPLQSLFEKSENPELGLFDQARNQEALAITQEILQGIDLTASTLDNTPSELGTSREDHQFRYATEHILQYIQKGAMELLRLTAPPQDDNMWQNHIHIEGDQLSKQELHQRIKEGSAAINAWADRNSHIKDWRGIDVTDMEIQRRDLFLDTVLAAATQTDFCHNKIMNPVINGHEKVINIFEKKFGQGSYVERMRARMSVLYYIKHHSSGEHQMRQYAAHVIGVNHLIPPYCAFV